MGLWIYTYRQLNTINNYVKMHVYFFPLLQTCFTSSQRFPSLWKRSRLHWDPNLTPLQILC